MKRLIFLIGILFLGIFCFAQKDSVVTKKDRKKDVLLQTSYGDIVVRLSDSTPLHRDNFLKLVKPHYYDIVLLSCVIKNFMTQLADPNRKHQNPGEPLGNGGPDYRI